MNVFYVFNMDCGQWVRQPVVSGAFRTETHAIFTRRDARVSPPSGLIRRLRSHAYRGAPEGLVCESLKRLEYPG
jgi:hypothetical protein